MNEIQNYILARLYLLQFRQKIIIIIHTHLTFVSAIKISPVLL